VHLPEEHAEGKDVRGLGEPSRWKGRVLRVVRGEREGERNGGGEESERKSRGTKRKRNEKKNGKAK
jgi:hypothetical protein